jgi:two-component system chemotaxis sensor kinase CheA
MNELIEQFLLESRELVEQATADLLAVEENPGDGERLDGAFRAFHTLKGSAGIVDFAAMAKVGHAAEDVLASVRAGKAQISRELISNCLGCLDLMLQWLDAMQIDGKMPSGADRQADAMAAQFSDAAPTIGITGAERVADVSRLGIDTRLSPNAMLVLGAQLKLLEQAPPAGPIGCLLSAGRVAVNVLRSARLHSEVAVIERAAGASAAAESGAQLAAAIRALIPAVGGPPGLNSESAPVPEVSARVLRVDVERVDALVKLTGELIVAKNAVGHAAQLALGQVDPQLLARLLKDQHGVLGRLIDELQRSVLTIRVLPLRHVFNRFPKLVREIAEALGKSAKLVTQGDETEADKVVVETLFEPLLHIIRNALDHGIEPASERERLGKPATATIQLRASRSGDAVLVEVEDDGRGIDVEKVRDLALKRGIANSETIAGMSEAEVVDLVFAPGFSTAAVVTGLSGRGVGMDVVRRGVERLGGTARIESSPGVGTTVILRLPFSVMLSRVMTVEAGGQTFGIPLDAVVETALIPRGHISPIGKSHAFVLRNRTIPLVDLARSVGNPGSDTLPPHAKIVVVSVGGQLSGFEVDQFGTQLDVMLKPLDGLLLGMPGVAGTSLLGTGGVLIVLDLPDLLQ